MTDSEMRAMHRAIAEDIHVLCCVTDVPNHRTDFLVQGSDGHTIYTVTEHSADDYSCNCQAGQNGLTCKHVAAVRLGGAHLHLHFL